MKTDPPKAKTTGPRYPALKAGMKIRFRSDDKLVEALINLIKSGNTSPSTAEILAKADFARGSLYRAIDSKKDLWIEALTRERAAWSRIQEDAFSSHWFDQPSADHILDKFEKHVRSEARDHSSPILLSYILCDNESPSPSRSPRKGVASEDIRKLAAKVFDDLAGTFIAAAEQNMQFSTEHMPTNLPSAYDAFIYLLATQESQRRKFGNRADEISVDKARASLMEFLGEWIAAEVQARTQVEEVNQVYIYE